MMISALSLYNVSNQPSISVIFKRDIMDKKEIDRSRKNCIEMMLSDNLSKMDDMKKNK